MLYLTDRGVEFNASIIEYDIRKANINLMRYYNLYDKSKLNFLEDLPKDKRERAVGLMLRKDPDLSKALEKAFNDIVYEFMTVNNIDKDDDVISIKKDAVFVCNKICQHTVFGPVEFIPKNKYHAFINIDRYEFYVGEDHVDVKGLGDSAQYHKNGICLLISDLVNMLETTFEPRRINEYLAQMVKLYKTKSLTIDMYREFNTNSKFKCNIDGRDMYLNDVGYEYLDEHVDISFNYINIILPLMRLFM